MSRKQFLFIGLVMITAILACQTITYPVPGTVAEPTQPGKLLPTDELPTLTDVSEVSLPAGFLTDPNTACAIDMDYALTCLDKDGWHIYDETAFKQPPWKPVTMYTPVLMIQCPGGRTYLTDGSAVYLLTGATPVKLGDKNIGGDMLACAPGDGLWAASMDDISFFNGSTWINYQATEKQWNSDPTELVDSITSAPNGNLYVAAGRNVATFDGTAWKIISPGSDSYGNLAVDASGNVWVSANHNLLMMYNGVKWTTYPPPENTFRDIWFIRFDREGRVWVAGRHAISIFDPQTNTLEQRSDEQAFINRMIFDLQFDGQDRLWVSTDYGLDVYDGSSWITYHMYTADLYSNTADRIVVFGDGPKPPALEQKAPGSVSGRLVNPTPAAGSPVELCLRPETRSTPCDTQAYHASTTVSADGNFLFPHIPVGKYHLIAAISDSWGNLVNSTSFDSEQSVEIIVEPGTETRLGDIQSSTDFNYSIH